MSLVRRLRSWCAGRLRRASALGGRLADRVDPYLANAVPASPAGAPAAHAVAPIEAGRPTAGPPAHWLARIAQADQSVLRWWQVGRRGRRLPPLPRPARVAGEKGTAHGDARGRRSAANRTGTSAADLPEKHASAVRRREAELVPVRTTPTSLHAVLPVLGEDRPRTAPSPALSLPLSPRRPALPPSSADTSGPRNVAAEGVLPDRAWSPDSRRVSAEPVEAFPALEDAVPVRVVSRVRPDPGRARVACHAEETTAHAAASEVVTTPPPPDLAVSGTAGDLAPADDAFGDVGDGRGAHLASPRLSGSGETGGRARSAPPASSDERPTTRTWPALSDEAAPAGADPRGAWRLDARTAPATGASGADGHQRTPPARSSGPTHDHDASEASGPAVPAVRWPADAVAWPELPDGTRALDEPWRTAERDRARRQRLDLEQQGRAWSA